MAGGAGEKRVVLGVKLLSREVPRPGTKGIGERVAAIATAIAAIGSRARGAGFFDRARRSLLSWNYMYYRAYV